MASSSRGSTGNYSDHRLDGRSEVILGEVYNVVELVGYPGYLAG